MRLNILSVAVTLIVPLILMLLLLIVTQAQGSKPSVMNAEKKEYATAEALGLMRGFPPPPGNRVDPSSALFGVPYNR